MTVTAGTPYDGWKRYRMRARRATTQGRWSDVIDIVRAFNAYCDRYGWPDWWADMERMERDAISARVRENFILGKDHKC